MPNGPSPKATVPAVGGLFFPQARSLGIDQTDTSPAVQQKIVYAGVAGRSFAEASTTLERLADLGDQAGSAFAKIRAEAKQAADAQVAGADAAFTAQQKDGSRSLIARMGGLIAASSTETIPAWRPPKDEADLLLNVSGGMTLADHHRRARLIAYVDTDPAFTQVAAELLDELGPEARRRGITLRPFALNVCGD